MSENWETTCVDHEFGNRDANAILAKESPSAATNDAEHAHAANGLAAAERIQRTQGDTAAGAALVREGHGPDIAQKEQGAAQNEQGAAHTEQGAAHAEQGAAHAEAKPAMAAESPTVAIFDLSDTITVAGIAAALRGIANEPGESGKITFQIEALGKFGTGVVNGLLEGWAKLAIGCAVDNTNLTRLTVEADGAISAGIDIAGFAQVSVEAGYGQNFRNQMFFGSESAATWIVGQLERLNEVGGGRVFKFGKDDPKDSDKGDHSGDNKGNGRDDSSAAAKPPLGKPMFEYSEKRVFAGVNASADVGALSGDASYQRMEVYRDYIDNQDHEYRTHETHNKASVGFNVKVGQTELGATYDYDAYVSSGSPFFLGNGNFRSSKLTIQLQPKDLLAKGGQSVETIPADSVQDFVLSVFSALEKVAGKFPHGAALNSGLFDSIVQQMYKYAKIGKKVNLSTEFDLQFTWDDFGQHGTDLQLMFFRVKVEPKFGVEVGQKTAAGGMKAGVSIAKSEVIYELIGTETIVYIRRQYIRATPDRPWATFKENNAAQVQQLAINMATPGFAFYAPAVADAYASGEGENVTAAIAAMESLWTNSDNRLAQVGRDASHMSSALAEGTSFWTLRQSTKKEQIDIMTTLLLKYSSDPAELQFFLTQLPLYGIDMNELRNFWKDMKQVDVYDEICSRAQPAD